MSDHPSLLRQWKLLKSLAARRNGLTVREAAEDFGVSQKTIRRDLDTFRELGFPIDVVEEAHGRRRWSIRPDWTEPQCNFTFDEAISMFVARRFLEPLAGTMFWQASRNAMAKIRASLRPEVIKYVDQMLDLLHETELGVGDYSKKAELIDRLMIGVEENRAVFITYQSQRATEPVTYDVYPYGIVYHRGSLYLVGFAPQLEEIRHWKVDRVEEAHLEDLRFQRPEDFDLRRHLAGSFGVFHGDDEVRIKIRFTPTVARYVTESKWHPSQQVSRNKGGSVDLTLQLSATEEVKSWVLSFGANATILEPAELREQVATEIESMLDRYSGRRNQNRRKAVRATHRSKKPST